MIASGGISTVHIGSIARLVGGGRGGADLLTAFVKTAVAGRVEVRQTGLVGDVQGNLRVHGGPEKAVYGYPLSGYDGWKADFPALADRFEPGAMGENLAVIGQDEASICIGDIIRCGTATLQIAQIREPCSTFAAVHGTTRVVRAMTRSGRCGWYYRVIEAGHVGAGDRHDVVDRWNPGWNIGRFAAFAAKGSATRDELAEIAALRGLTPRWQEKARATLAKDRAR